MLDDLCKSNSETEVVEFKEAKNSYTFNEIGKYFSALSNEANLQRDNRIQLDNLKGEIANKTTNRVTFIEIYEISTTEGRVVMFQIPAAPKGLPIAFEGHYYGRDGEELSPLNIEEIERIRSQFNAKDWSAAIIDEATIIDLDNQALTTARVNYKSKFPDLASEVDSWDTVTFLNKAKITIKGKITRTAIVLLGKDESEHYISPAEAKIRWLLKDSNGNDSDYLIIGCPLLLAVDQIYAKIRNSKYRYLKEGTLFPEEIDKYEPFIIREAINNCIAHQDYSEGGRINVIEMEDQLIFTNRGSFIPGSVEKVVHENAPEERYRNPFLATAMFNLKMVDTVGSGIRKMFNYQRQRYFPLPDYDLTECRVEVTIIGKVLNIDYARILARNRSLSLEDIMLLDKVQKKLPLSELAAKHLKAHNLIEGRRPNYFLSKNVSQMAGQKAVYTRYRGFDKAYYLDLILKAIDQYRALERKDVNELLWNKLPDWMVDTQKKTKISNLLSELRKTGQIQNSGSDKKPIWEKTSKN
ncbi:MAG: transcriptional regulator [Chloroflexi bacterium]|nr:transcriptional regulator [Chloroflexota bacterium]